MILLFTLFQTLFQRASRLYLRRYLSVRRVRTPHPMHSPCISVDSLLSACECPAPIHSTGPHPNTSMMCVCWTLVRIPRLLGPYGSAHGSCKPCAVRPRRIAAHFFPHTRPPDTHAHSSPQHSTFTHTLAVASPQYTTFTLTLASVEAACLEYWGFLVNTYSSLALRSMGGNGRHRKQPRPASLPADRPQDGLDSLGYDTVALDEDDALASDDGARDTSMPTEVPEVLHLPASVSVALHVEVLVVLATVATPAP